MLNSKDFILGIDPGKNLGISIYELDENLDINLVETRVYYLDKFIKNKNIENVERCIALGNIMKDLLEEYDPMAIGCEDVFASRFPLAVIQLAQYLMTIRTTIYEYDKTLIPYLYAPKLVKAYIGATGNATKEDMLKAVRKIEVLKPFVKDEMTEHEIDAMAIGYLACQEERKKLLTWNSN